MLLYMHQDAPRRNSGYLLTALPHAGNLAVVLHYTLDITRAFIACPFHDEVARIRLGDDAAGACCPTLRSDRSGCPKDMAAGRHSTASERSHASLAMAFAASSCSACTRVSSFEFSAPSR